MKPDITSRKDLTALMEEFYRIALHDDQIGHHFQHTNLEQHIPLMVDFWEKTLFARPVYGGNTLGVHQEFSQHHSMPTEQFRRWIEIFVAAVDRLFAGEVAERAKYRGRMIADGLDQRLNRMEHIQTGK